MDAALLIARVVVAAVFALAAVTKLADLAGSRAAVAAFGVPDRLARPLGTVLPLAELAVALALVPAASARLGAAAACVLLAAFALAIARSMARGEAPECHCFGQVHSEPAGPRTLARNVALAGVAASVAFGAGAAAVAGLAVLGAVGAFSIVARARAARLASPGAAAPAFSLPGLDGDRLTLGALTGTGRPVLLLFTDPRCGPCHALMPRISAWQREHGDRLTIAVLTRGSAADNQPVMHEHGIADVGLDEGLAVYRAYAVAGTPGGVLVDAGGRVTGEVAAGADAIATLVRSVVGEAGPAIADAAPVPLGELVLRDLAGDPVPLTDPRRDTLLLFWNPSCGFCRTLLDDVRAFERSAPGDAPRLVVLSTGSVADNVALGLRSPVVIEGGAAVAAALGAAGTPSAILVDRAGAVVSRIALGGPEVMALANGVSRRDALLAGGAVLAGVVVASPAEALAAASGHCPPHHVRCQGTCCPKGEVCLPPKRRRGKRRCGCPSHKSRCGNRCVDLHADRHNCGRCGHACGPAQLCNHGTCTCLPGETACGAGCVSVASDAQNCGTCGHVCPSGQACVSGACTVSCPSGQTICGSACVALASDPQNCGACGTVCPAGDVCANGVCVSQCPTGQTACGGACVDLSSDASHCGACGTACPPGGVCTNGTCGCGPGMSICGGVCVNAQTDAGHCGSGCVNCNGLPFVRSAHCANGTCVIDQCAPNWVDCDGNPLNGCETLGTICPP
jgi:thiol-disulfide isomerase/thioredoxin